MEKLRKYTTIFYSTHILDDVQRVSDTVAILNRGTLIAEAPINELLAGDGGSAIYDITLKSGVEAALAEAQEPRDQPALGAKPEYGGGRRPDRLAGQRDR